MTCRVRSRRARAAQPRRPRVEIVDFGDCGGVLLLAEYDAECDTIRVNARAVECVRASGGAAQAAHFIESAIAHERFHRAHPGASEVAAHEHVRALLGGDPRRFETWVRGAAREHA